MLISCIIPTKDRCCMVMEAISSIIRQRPTPPEIVLVDDGSTDSTVPAVSSRYPEIRIIRLSGVGPGPARNAGAAKASGDVLMFLDSDDLWCDHHIQALQKTLRRGFEVAYGVTRTEDSVDGGAFLIPDKGDGMEGDCLPALLRWCFMVPSATAISRKAFTAVNGFGAEEFGEDWAFFLRLAQRFPFGFAKGPPITLRRLHHGSLCCRPDNDKILTAVRGMKRIIAAENHDRSDDPAHFQRLENWIIEKGKQRKGEKWTTVQQWFLAMRKEMLL